ncbi:MAG: hypothetical protein ACFCVE_09805 [Phycisphaerae bacterium]
MPSRVTIILAVVLVGLAGVVYLASVGVRAVAWVQASEQAEPLVIYWQVTEALRPQEVGAEVWPREPGKGPWYVEPDRPVQLILPDGTTHLLPPHVAQAWQDEKGRLRGLRLILPPVTIHEAAAEMERVCRDWGVWRDGDDQAVAWYVEDQILERVTLNHMAIQGPLDADFPLYIELRRGQAADEKRWHVIVSIGFNKQLAKLDGVEPEPPFEKPRITGVRQLRYSPENKH